MPRYRIVRDKYLGYEAQSWRWWWPFWMQMGFANTHSTIESAQNYISRRSGEVVWESYSETHEIDGL